MLNQFSFISAPYSATNLWFIQTCLDSFIQTYLESSSK
jgi:hypothetical protein